MHKEAEQHSFTSSPSSVSLLLAPFQVMHLLIERGADVTRASTDGTTPLNAACKDARSSVALRLLELDVDALAPDHSQQSAIYSAASTGLDTVVKRLLAVGADPTAVRNDNTSPLFAAARHGHLAVVKLLLTKRVPMDVAVRRDCARRQTTRSGIVSHVDSTDARNDGVALFVVYGRGLYVFV